MSNETAQETTSGPTGYEGFLGTNEVAVQERASEPVVSDVNNPEPITDNDPEVQEQPATEAPETETAETEADDFQLPTEQAKVFGDEVYAKYAKRYGFSEEQAQDPLVRRLLHDKINSDIEIASSRSAAAEDEEEPTLEDEAVEEEDTQPEAAQPVTPEQIQAHMKQLDDFAAQVTDPAMAEAFHAEFVKAWGGDPSAYKPEEKVAFGRTMTKFGLNLMSTALPNVLLTPDPQGLTLLDRALEARFPGTLARAEKQTWADAWNEVRTSDPTFANLPEYGPAGEKSEFGKLMAKVVKDFPQITQIEFRGKDGRFLPRQEQAREFYKLAAKLVSGNKPDPVAAAKTFEAAKKSVERATVQKQAGKLGAGQSKQEFPAQNEPDYLKEAISKYRSENAPILGNK